MVTREIAVMYDYSTILAYYSSKNHQAYLIWVVIEPENFHDMTSQKRNVANKTFTNTFVVAGVN